jgi:WD40 repeat protein
MFRLKLVITTLVIALIVLVTVPATSRTVQAQEGPRSIPILGMQPMYRLAPDGHTVAVFELANIHDLEVAPQYLAIRLIDLDSGEQVQEFTGFTDFANDVAFTPDGSRLVSYHINGYLYVWDVSSGELIQTLPILPGQYYRLVFTADGTRLFTLGGGSYFTQVLEWDLTSGTITRIFTHHFDHYKDQQAMVSDIRESGHYNAIALILTPDNTRFVTATLSGDLWLWDRTTGLPDHLLEGRELPQFGVTQMAFAPDGSTLYYFDTVTDPRTLYALDLASRTVTPITTLEASPAFALAPDGQSFAWVEDDARVIHLANLADPATRTDIPLALPDTLSASSLDNYFVPQAALRFSPDGTRLILAGFTNSGGDDNVMLVIPVP